MRVSPRNLLLPLGRADRLTLAVSQEGLQSADGADRCIAEGILCFRAAACASFRRHRRTPTPGAVADKAIVISGFDIVTCYFDRRKSCGTVSHVDRIEFRSSMFAATL
jgi:hypothetical protein